MATSNTIINVTFQGQTILDTAFIPSGAAGTVNNQQVPLGNLSGVTYDAVNNRYYAISDDRSQVAPARFYTFTTDPATINTTGVNFTNVTPLRDSNNNFFPVNTIDLEGIALTNNGTVFISSEGGININAGIIIDPFVREYSLTTGEEVRSLTIPEKFLPIVLDTNDDGLINTGDTQISGIRNNLAFESLTITPDQKTLFTATENALFQDGSANNTGNITRSRIIQYNLKSGQPEKEYLYSTETNNTGLVDLLAIDNQGTLLALERTFDPTLGVTIKIYEISVQSATDISAIDSLNSLTTQELGAIQPVKKRLVLDLTELNLPNSDGFHPTGLDNIEGLTFGPKLADGRQSIVLVSDNNFNQSQFTQILALSAGIQSIPDDESTVQLSLVGDDVFQITGNNQSQLKVTLSGRNSSQVNELGVFTVDDAAGTIDGVAPGSAEYTVKALARARVIFSAIANNPNGFNPASLSRLLEFSSSSNLRFYLVSNASTDALNTGSISTSNIIFSNSTSQQITNLGAEGFTLAWQNTSSNFQDLVVRIQAVDESLPLGTSLQGQSQGEVIDLRDITGNVRADFTVNREAAFDNFVGFYRVANTNGGIDTNSDGIADILPGQAGYIQAAIQNRVVGIDLTVNNQGTATYTGTLSGGAIFVPFIIIDSRPDALLDSNTSNDPAVYFSYLGANTDGFDHIRLLGDNTFGFEDLPNGGDQDFNDVIVKVNLSIA
ncbi:esterase-like activity of phytase family protein [Nostoc spongiaeforme FACHB-130]|uniref:Esterase-like activity of phytase family protein n=1 Tax=Nostoc spongiaeforme FACHB-130 TaxID=1357510 RepID=A0ABR8G3I3_9NOSO|nr:esterase-like activity of phytase family protein [Nostoc spongiaeforme FACHB-130]